MKTTIALLLLLTTTSFARLFETPAQLDVRYGKPSGLNNSDPELLPGVERREYEFQGLSLTIYVYKGTSQLEVYQSPERLYATIENRTLNTILAANSPKGKWKYLITGYPERGRTWEHSYVSALDQGRLPKLTASLSGDELTLIVAVSDFRAAQGRQISSARTRKGF